MATKLSDILPEDPDYSTDPYCIQQTKPIDYFVRFYYNVCKFSIIPLKAKDKKPNIESWKEYITKRPTREQIQTWLKENKFENIGVVCGSVSDNLVVIDIDDKIIVDDLNLNFHQISLDGGYVVETGKGFHIYIKHNSDPGNIIKNDELHIEYRANGGYVVAPPSIHPTGKKYLFKYWSKEKLKEKDAKKIFDNWVKVLEEKKGIKKPSKKKIPELKKGVVYGARNDSSFKLACDYRDRGLSIEETTKLMMDWNRKNRPPLHDNELLTTIKSAYSRSNKEQEQQGKQGQQGEQQIGIKGCGGVYGDLVIEPLGDYQYIYNYNGKRGVANTNYDQEIKTSSITIESSIFVFKDKPLKRVLFNVPSDEAIQEYIAGSYQVKDAQTLFKQVMKYLKILYDTEKVYYPLITVGIFQSWLISKLQAVFYEGFEAKYGGAKTVFLEGLAILSRHGFLAGNITSAGVGRLTEKYEWSLFADEIDVRTKGKDNELYEVFRIGYRRNNPYVRLKDGRHNYDEDVGDPFGFKGFSVHSEVEKALKTRSIVIPLRTSLNTKLPILNLFKATIGKPLFEDLFFWYMENIKDSVALVSLVALLPCVLSIEQGNDDIEAVRQKLFDEILKDFTEEEIQILLKFFGRNEELLYIALSVCKALGVNVVNELEQAFTYKKESDDPYNDNYLIGLLRDLLVYTYNLHVKKESNNELPILNDIEINSIQEGELSGCYYCGKTQFYEIYRTHLKSKDIKPVAQDTFSEFLLELGFNDNINVKKERFGKNRDKLLKALIFDDVALQQLGIEKKKNLELEDFEVKQ